MNETTEPNHYRLDIHLDGNGAKPHMVYKSKDVRKLLEMAYKLDRRADTIWLMWKEFVNKSRDTSCPASKRESGDLPNIARRDEMREK